MRNDFLLFIPLIVLLLIFAPAPYISAATTLDVMVDYGARGDGASDDTAAFQAALSRLSYLGGGTLIVPRRTYLVRPDSLVIGSGISVVGKNAVIRANRVGLSLVTIGGSRISVTGLTVDGANLVIRGVDVARGGTDIIVRNTMIMRFTHPSDPNSPFYFHTPTGVRVEGDGNRITFGGVHIRNITATHRTGGETGSMAARGMLIDRDMNAMTISKDVTVEDSIFYDIGSKDGGDCLVIQGAVEPANLLLRENTFDRCHKRAIVIQVPRATITGNYIKNPFLGDNPYIASPDANTFDMHAGISVYASDVTITENTIEGVGSYLNGIEIGPADSIRNITIKGNHISNGSKSNIETPSSLIRTYADIENLTITGNTLGNAAIGLYLDRKLINPSISKNSIYDVKHERLPKQ